MATAAPVPSCKVCCKLLPNSRERRNLTTAASASVVAMIKEICSNLSLSAENFVVQMPFLCRPCFRRVDRLITLKKELQELQTNLEVCTSTIFKLKKKRSIASIKHFRGIYYQSGKVLLKQWKWLQHQCLLQHHQDDQD